jgi:membrane-associated protein
MQLAQISETITRLLTSGDSSLGIVLMGLAAGLKYVFPPFPSDALVVSSVFLIARQKSALAGAAVSVLFFSAIGFMLQYAAGRFIASREEHWNTGWRGRLRPRLELVMERFRRHGALYVAINRFVPGFRAVMFLAAGMARLPAWQVLVWGLVGTAAWTAILFTIGATFGHQWERVQRIFETWGWVAALSVLGAIAVAAAAHWLVTRARRRR